MRLKTQVEIEKNYMKNKQNFKIKNVEIGKDFVVIGGPCAIESKEQLSKTADLIKDNIDILRGGAFKPRTKPGNFEGLKEKGLKLLKDVSKKIQKPTITEVMDPRDVELVANYTDILQIGTRSMQNFPLLKESGISKMPVLLKRGMSATIEEWLGAAKYILNEGNEKVVLCERGIRTFEKSTRFTFDLAGAILAQKESGLPVIADPSHATGIPGLIKPITLASKAAGLDGVMIEVHYNPNNAKCDANQALTPDQFNKIFK